MRQRHPFPTWKYLAPGAPGVAAFGFFACEQFFQQRSWWPDVPWLAFFVAAAVFIAGAAYADLLNPRSSLREWWRDWRRPAEINAVYPDHTWDDANRQGTERVDIWAVLRLERCLPGGVIRVRAGILKDWEKNCRVVASKPLDGVAAQQEVRMRLGSVAIGGARHSLWGEELGSKDLPPSKSSILRGDSKIEISIENGKGRQIQTYAIFVRRNDPARVDTAHICLLTEDEGLQQ